MAKSSLSRRMNRRVARVGPPHGDEDAVGRTPATVLDQAMEHAGRLNGQHEARLGCKLQILHRRRDGVGARAEARAVDGQLIPCIPIDIGDDQ